MASTFRSDAPSLDAEHLAVSVLRALSAAAAGGERCGLEELSRALHVRRADVRSALSALHRQGLVDVLRMRPTLAGFAVGRAAEGLALAPLRRLRAAAAVHAA